MAGNLNAGTAASQVATQRIFSAAGVGDIWTGTGIWSVFFRCRNKDLAQSGYAFHFGTSTNAYGTLLAFNRAGNGSIDLLVRCGVGEIQARTSNAGIHASTATAYSVGVTCDGLTGGLIAGASTHIYSGTGTGVMAEVGYAATGGTSAAGPSANDLGIDLGNRGGVDRPAEMDIADVFVWKGVALTAAELSALDGGADPRSIQPSFLMVNLPLVGMDLWDSAQQAFWSTTNAPTAIEFPHGPRINRIADGFPVPSGLGAYWSADDGVIDEQTTTINNARTLLDLAGTSRALYQSTDTSRPRYKNCPDGKVIAFAVPAELTANGSSFLVNNETALNNADCTWSGVHWCLTVDGTREFMNGAVIVGTDANGALTVTVSGSTYTPLPARYLQSKPMPWIVTVGGPSSGLAVRTITLYTTEGISTVQTAAYTPATSDITRVGPTAADGDGRHWIGFKRFAMHTRAVTVAEAAAMLLFYQGVARGPSRHRGAYLYAGSSSAEGNNACRDDCRGLVYQMTTLGTARAYSYGDFNTSLASVRVTVIDSGTYTPDETLNQAGSGAVGKLLYQNGTQLYIYDVTGAAFNNSGIITGVTSGVNRTASATNNANSGLYSAARYAHIHRLLSLGSDGPQVLNLFTDSNGINNSWDPTDVVECLKRFAIKLRADFPALILHITTSIPRSGGLGANHIAYNTGIKAAAAAANWQVVALDELPDFDFKDLAFVVDNGVVDSTTGASYQRIGVPGAAGRDDIHVYSEGFGLQAAVASNLLGSTFADSASGNLGRFAERFPRF